MWLKLSFPLLSCTCVTLCALICSLIAFAHACCRGSYMKMLDKLAKDYMAQLMDPKMPFKQDEDREYILRFFAFHNSLKNFKPSLHQFLNAEIRPNRNLSADAVGKGPVPLSKSLSVCVLVLLTSCVASKSRLPKPMRALTTALDCRQLALMEQKCFKGTTG